MGVRCGLVAALAAVAALSRGGAAEAGAAAERDGRFEGDMIVPEDLLGEMFGAQVAARAAARGETVPARPAQAIGTRSTTRRQSRLWDTRVDDIVEVPYTFASGFNADQETRIQDALERLASATQVIRVVPWTGQTDYIEFTAESGCWSYVGRLGGRQQVNLSPSGCLSRGTIQHEFMHALGFFHEQSRSDRDDFISVNWDNISERYWPNFEKMSPISSSTLGTDYDYASVMHYSAYSFSNNGLPTLDTHGQAVGQRDGVSPLDVQEIRLMYRCPSGPREFRSFCSEDCPCPEGEGDCDSDEDCDGTLVCEHGSAGNERCRDEYDRCSPLKPCPENVGDCDSDADCMDGLVCKFLPGIDVCARPEHPTTDGELRTLPPSPSSSPPPSVAATAAPTHHITPRPTAASAAASDASAPADVAAGHESPATEVVLEDAGKEELPADSTAVPRDERNSVAPVAGVLPSTALLAAGAAGGAGAAIVVAAAALFANRFRHGRDRSQSQSKVRSVSLSEMADSKTLSSMV